MTKEEKDLLLKDLCARLPYGVRMKELEPVNGIELELYLTSIYKDNVQVNTPGGGVMASVIDSFKPYLRPLSSMTKKERKEYEKTCFFSNEIGTIATLESADWLNAHHFDYRGLIEKGLALEATKDMYKN